MAKNRRVRTRQEAKSDLEARGITVADWARKHGFPPLAVHQVLNGLTKGKRGKAHQIAVALGIKANPDAQAA